MKLHQIGGLFSRAVAGGVLIYAGFSKAVAPSAEFAAALAAYKILPGNLLSPIAQVWPWMELLAGTYILFGFYTRLFARVAAGMFGVFLAVLVSALARGIDPGSCGCFGIGINLSLQKTAGLDAVLLILSFLLYMLSKAPLPYSVDHWANKA